MPSREQIWLEALQEAKKLAEIVAESQTKLKALDKECRPINPRKFTLAELFNALDRSKDSYKNEDLNGPKGFLRKGFRKLGENAETFKLWLNMVPSDPQYTAPIIGSFLIFLNVRFMPVVE